MSYSSSQAKKRNKQRHTQDGLCLNCIERSLPLSLFCEKHYFKVLSRRYFGHPDNWHKFQDLFYKQEKKCYLTGRMLLLGYNAVVDHKKPIAKGGLTAMPNLAWCDREVNQKKFTLTVKEFCEKYRV